MHSSHLCIIDCGSKTTDTICSTVESFCTSCHVIALADANSSPLNKYSGIIISGGPHYFTDEGSSKKLVQQFSFIDTLQKPALGICLGHQAIGVHFGIPAFKGKEIQGEERIKLVAPHPPVSTLGEEAVFWGNHCEGILLPKDFRLIGCSEFYPVEIMACLSKPIFGVQFHPENSGEQGKKVFLNFIRICNALI